MTTTRVPLIAGNWKMNLDHLQAVALVQKLAWELRDGKHDFSKAEVVVFPPFTDLRGVQTLVDADKLDIEYGGQDISKHDSGAYTGDVSGVFLAKLGCSYALMGHSERREYQHETDADVNAKVRAAVRNGIAPLLCVGEALEVRKAGGQVAHVEAQIAAALDGLTAEELDKLVIAYEPIWAIGTGETATAADAQEVLGAVRAQLAKLYSPEFAEKTRLLYGGSMKPGNAPELLAQPDVDGGLIGGASLKAEDFAAIAHAAL